MTDFKAASAHPHDAGFGRAPDPEGPAFWSNPQELSFAFGTPGDDTLHGRNGSDLILGFGGNDLIQGNGGGDIILGGPGNDTLRGGAGDDIFVFSPGDGFDTIADFEPGDRILLLGISADEASLIPTPNGLNGPPSGIDLVYGLANEGQGVVYLPGLTNADFQSVQDALIFG